MSKVIITSIICISLHFPCLGQDLYEYAVPKKLNDGWETASLSDIDQERNRIRQLFTQLLREPHKIHSILAIHKNKLVLEAYFNGYSVEKPHDLRSVTKSIRSILVGIAIDEGFINSVDDPIFNYLKSHKPQKNLNDSKNKITIRNLLTMSSGLDCNDWDKKSKGQEDKVYKKKDWIQYTLDLPMIHEPGEISTYCSMGTVLLGEIISQASGMSIQAFAQQYLFDPLGISNVTWGHTSDKEVIASGKRLYLTPRDLGKVGEMVLNQGKWKEDQVVSAQWIQEAISVKTKVAGIDYGYLWWNLPFHIQGESHIARTATGNGGQYILIFPDLELVMIFTGGAYNSQEDKFPFAMVRDVFLPTFKD